MDEHYDVIVVGGGFYGVLAACVAAEKGRHVLLCEREADILYGASWVNQARVHNGYHYPRSLRTAARSHAHYDRFCEEFAASIHKTDSYYAIAASGSRVTAHQFERLCHVLGLPLEPADRSDLVNPSSVSGLWRVEEDVFDVRQLRQLLTVRLQQAGVTVAFDCQVVDVSPDQNGRGIITTNAGDHAYAELVLNCTYAQLRTLQPNMPGFLYECAELVVVRAPAAYSNVGLTVMDGAFFSCTPFPALDGHVLSHVRYTPHAMSETEPWFTKLTPKSRTVEMMYAAGLIAPWVRDCEPLQSLFTVKVVPARRDYDDARPIVLYRDEEQPWLVGVLGSKFDTVYDFLAWLEAELV